MTPPSAADVFAARDRIAGHVVRTPMLRNAALDALVGATILIKAEPLQRTGSFKLRGATNALRALDPEMAARGVVTHSSGNHGQAIACAAASLDIPATVAMPADAPAVKAASTRAWGAEIVTYDRIHDDREAVARGLAERLGATLVPPFEHPQVIAGQGTLALELAEDAASAGLAMDAMLVCTGGGGLVAGCALVLEAVSPGTRIHPVEPAGWDDTGRSLLAGERLDNPSNGSVLCDALLAKRPGALTFEVNRTRLSAGVAVTDEQVLAAMAFAFRHLKLVVEPGGAVCLAALLSGAFAARGVVGIVLSGGNVDPAVFARALA